MNKKNILSFVLIGALFSMTLGVVTKASAKDHVNNITQCGYIDTNALKGYESIEILGTKYDLSNVNSAVVQVVIRAYDDINSENLTGELKNETLKPVKEILDKYMNDPSKFENFPVTLDLGPSSLLREEINFVQEKIRDLKEEQESIKRSKMHQKAIDEKVEELQEEINKLSMWINYSVVNFKSENYKKTFCNEPVVNNDVDQENKEILFSFVNADSDHENIFRAIVKSNGEFEIQGSEISEDEIYEIIERSLEYENLKVRNLLQDIEMIKLTKLSEIEQKNRIKELEKEIQSVKAYGAAKEIILLNLTRSSVERTRISPKLMEERIRIINDEIKQRIETLNKYNDDPNYVIQNSELGKKASYFGYVFEEESGFAVKVEFDEKDNVVFKDMETLSAEQKSILNKLVSESIKEAEEDINELELDKYKLETSENSNYYLIDGITKEIAILNNDINNYKNILSKI